MGIPDIILLRVSTTSQVPKIPRHGITCHCFSLLYWRVDANYEACAQHCPKYSVFCNKSVSRCKVAKKEERLQKNVAQPQIMTWQGKSVVGILKISIHLLTYTGENLLSPVIQATWEARTVGWFEVERRIGTIIVFRNETIFKGHAVAR